MKPSRSPMAQLIAAALLASFALAGNQTPDVTPQAAPAPQVGQLALQVGTIDLTQRSNLLTDPAATVAAGQHYVLQFDGPMTVERRAALDAAGIELGDYLPPYAYTVRMDAARLGAVRSVPGASWLGGYPSTWKLSPEIGLRTYATPERQDLQAAGLVAVDLSLFSDTAAEAAFAVLDEMPDATVVRQELVGATPVVTVVLPLDQVVLLSGIEAVQWIEESPEITERNASARWIVQTNINGNYKIHNQGIHGEGQVLGILDSLVDPNHCSFSDPGVPYGPSHRKILAYNGSGGAGSHGTHCGGIAAGDAGNTGDTRGHAYMAKMCIDAYGSLTEANIYSKLTTHHNQGARVHTNSWGNDGTTSYDGLCRAFDRFTYDNEESLTVLAVTNTSTLRNPENAKNLLAVGATNDTPGQASHCTAGVGPTSDGRRKPEIYAPGCGILSAASNTACNLASLSGTSMACPAIAGNGLLVRQYYTDGFYPGGIASPDGFIPSGALIKATLINAAVDMTGVSGYPSNLEGWGRLLLDNALYFPGDARKLFVADVFNANGLNTNDVDEYLVQVVSGSEQLRVTIAFVDPAATSGAGFAAVNDLDLEVVSPSGDVYKGNVFAGGVSTTGGSKDDRNNVEQVHVSNPTTGGWTVRIIGAGVNVGTQGYSLVVTGDITPDEPALTLRLPNGTPDVVAPGGQITFPVEILPGDENIVPGSEEVYYRFDGGAYIALPLSNMGGGQYMATLPAADCGDSPEFYVRVEGDGGTIRTEPQDAPTSAFSAVVGTLNVSFMDTANTDLGWTLGDPGDTATTGQWSRMVSQATDAQPGGGHDDPSGFCFVTDGRAGLSVGTYDIDGGIVTLTTPQLDLTGSLSPTISYWRWFSNNQGGGAGEDTMTVEISNGGGWVLVDQAGPTQDAGGGWVYHEFKPADFVALNSTIQLRFIAGDLGAGSIVEAAIDDLMVSEFVCEPATCSGDLTGDSVVDFDDFGQLSSCWGQPCGDLTGDALTDFDDFAALSSDWGCGQ